MSIKSKLKTTLKTLSLLLLGVITVLIVLFIIDIKMSTPPINEELTIDQYEREEIGPNHYKVNNCWLKLNDQGIWEMYLEGEPYERGLIYGILSKELMEKQEVHFVNQINEFVPNRFFLFFLKMFVAFFNSDLDEFIPIENQTEIYGVSQSFSDKYDYIAPKYYRILNYHTAHDIGHVLKDLSMVGCTSFSVNKELSADSSLLLARNFDFYMGEKFAEDKLLLFLKPNKGYAFASYSWAGLTGVVSGINEKGITVTLNASKSDLPTGAKDPISILAREILQYSANIEDAIKIAKTREVFVSESILIGSSADNNTIIIEKSPQKMDVYDSGNNLVICANHYQADLFKNDSINISNIKNSDSKHRFDRMNALIKENSPISINDAVAILRDKQGINNEFIGYGNPKSINQLIAHHAIIFKPSQKQFWVSTPPYQLGNFIGYDLNSVFNDPSKLNYIDTITINKDSFLQSTDFKNYEIFRVIKEKILKHIMLNKPIKLSQKSISKFISTNPKCYITFMTLGQYFQFNQQYSDAIKYYNQALDYSLASIDEENSIKSSIKECEKSLEKLDVER